MPKDANKDRPAPVFLFGDHCNAANSATHTWEYPGVPTNAITARGYAYVRINFNDVAPAVPPRPPCPVGAAFHRRHAATLASPAATPVPLSDRRAKPEPERKT